MRDGISNTLPHAKGNIYQRLLLDIIDNVTNLQSRIKLLSRGQARLHNLDNFALRVLVDNNPGTREEGGGLPYESDGGDHRTF